MKRLAYLCLAATVLVAAGPVSARDDGIDVGKPSMLRKMVSAEDVEKLGAKQYAKVRDDAEANGTLLAGNDKRVKRVQRIAEHLLPHAVRFNERARDWPWEINVIDSPTINAFCMPGGKIAVYTGIIDKLRLTDDELAMIMGHEIAHALREHARERMAKTKLTRIGAEALGFLVGSEAARQLAHKGGQLLTLKFSRNDETEADLIGMELAARAGYDPAAGVTLWQKMGKAAKQARYEFMSTHPSGESRIAVIEEHLPQVTPLYEAARRR